MATNPFDVFDQPAAPAGRPAAAPANPFDAFDAAPGPATVRTGTMRDPNPPPRQRSWMAEQVGDTGAAFARGVGESALPATAGLAAFGPSAAAGGTAGAALGTAIAPGVGTAIGGGIGSIGGGILGAMGAGYLVQRAQDAIVSRLPQGVQEFLGQDQETRAFDEADRTRSLARFGGGIASQAITMRPGPLAASLLERGLGAGLGGGIEAGTELAQTGEIDPVRVAMAAAGGALFTRQNRLGDMVNPRGTFRPRPTAAPEGVPDPAMAAPAETILSPEDAALLSRFGATADQFSDPTALDAALARLRANEARGGTPLRAGILNDLPATDARGRPINRTVDELATVDDRLAAGLADGSINPAAAPQPPEFGRVIDNAAPIRVTAEGQAIDPRTEGPGLDVAMARQTEGEFNLIQAGARASDMDPVTGRVAGELAAYQQQGRPRDDRYYRLLGVLEGRLSRLPANDAVAPPAPSVMRAPDMSEAAGSRAQPYTFDGVGRSTGRATDNMGVAEDTNAPRQRAPAGRMGDGVGLGNRPFRVDPNDANAAFFEQEANNRRQAAFDDLVRRWEERQRAQARGDRQQQERAESVGPDPSQSYSRYGQRPAQDEATGMWRMTRDGLVADANGRPVAFRNHREAARFAADNDLAGDFDLAVWGANTTRVVLRRRPNSTYGQPRPDSPGGGQPRPEAPPADAAPAGRPRALPGPEAPQPAPRAQAPAPEPAPQPTVRPAPEPMAEARVRGQRETVVTDRGRQVETEFEVREADELISSDDARFDQSIQPRDRAGRASSDVQVAQIAGNLDPGQLGSNRLATSGAPIIGPDGMVESGNGRVMAIRRAYDVAPERAAAYRQMIEGMGLSTEGMQRPVLVRRRVTDMTPDERRQWAVEANEQHTAQMSPAEQALADGRSLDADTLALYRGGDVDAAGNREFVRAFVDRVVSPAMRPRMVQADGSLSIEGIRRVQGAMLARAYGDADLVAKIVEDPDTDIKAIGNALVEAAPNMAKVKALVETGALPAEFDVSQQIVAMARTISQARREGRRVSDLIAQVDAFNPNPVDPITEALLRVAFRDDGMTKPRAGSKVADALRFYGDEAERIAAMGADGPGLFGDAAPTPGPRDVLGAARRRLDGDPAENANAAQGDIFASRPESDGGGAAPPGDGQQGRPGPADGGGEAGGDGAAAAANGGPTGEGVIDLVGRLIRDKSGASPNPLENSQLAKDIAAVVSHLRGSTALETIGNILDKASILGRPFASYYAGNDFRLRALGRRFESDAIRELADMFEARAGQADGTQRTYHEAVHFNERRMGQQMFRAVESIIDDPAAMAKVRDALTGKRLSLTAAEQKAVADVRKLLDEIHVYRREAGEDLGKIERTYFPRVLDPTLVAKGKERFTRAAVQLYRELGEEDPQAMAEAWFRRILNEHAGVDGSLLDVRRSKAPGTASGRERTFGPRADELLRDFYQQDPWQTLNSYVSGSVKRAEYTRRFGMDGEAGSPARAAWEKAHGGKTKLQVLEERIQNDIVASGQDAGDAMDLINSSLEANLGILGKVSQNVRFGISLAHAWNQLGKMGHTAVTSLTELAMGYARSGDVATGSRFVVDAVTEFGRQIARMQPSDAMRYAEALGSIVDAQLESTQAARATALDARGVINDTMGKFYRLSGLHQLTNAQRIAATKMGVTMLNQMAGDLASKDKRLVKRARDSLAELGVADPDAFAAYLKKTDGRPSLDDIASDKGQAAVFNTAMARIVSETVMAPTRAQKPILASHPLGSLAYGLMSYSFGFKYKVLDRMAATAARGVRDKDPALMAFAALGLPALLAFTYINDTFVRPALFGSTYDYDKETGPVTAARVASRANLFGAFDPLIQYFFGTKYKRDFLQTYAGSVVGSAAQSMDRIATLKSDRNSPNTNTAERNAAGAVYDLFIAPVANGAAARYVGGVAGAGAVYATTNRPGGIGPSPREAFITAMAGPERKEDPW